MIDEDKKLDIIDLSPRKQNFVHLFLTGRYTYPKIAELLGLSVETIRRYTRDVAVQRVLADMQKDQQKCVAMGLKSLSEKALHAMNELLSSPVDAVRLQAVKDVLDRTGHKPKQEKEVNINQTFTFEQKMKTLIEDTIYDVEVEAIEDDEGGEGGEDD